MRMKKREYRQTGDGCFAANDVVGGRGEMASCFWERRYGGLCVSWEPLLLWLLLFPCLASYFLFGCIYLSAWKEGRTAVALLFLLLLACLLACLLWMLAGTVWRGACALVEGACLLCLGSSSCIGVGVCVSLRENVP